MKGVVRAAAVGWENWGRSAGAELAEAEFPDPEPPYEERPEDEFPAAEPLYGERPEYEFPDPEPPYDERPEKEFSENGELSSDSSTGQLRNLRFISFRKRLGG